MPRTLTCRTCQRVCEPCEYHKLDGAFHARCGEGSWRMWSCTHPDAFHNLPLPEDPAKRAIALEMRARHQAEGRMIGRPDSQPQWCPLRRTE